MFSRFGIGARLFIAFLGISGLSMSSGVAGWYILRAISQAQSRINAEALPAVAAAQRTAELSARLVAAAPSLTAVRDEQSRTRQEAELYSLADEIRKSVTDASFSPLDQDAMPKLAGDVDALVSNLSAQSRLVKERLELQRGFTSRAERNIAAATAIVDLSETLVSNASAGASAVVSNLYSLVDEVERHGQAYDALDRLIEQDIYLLDRMWELRLRSSQIALLTNRLTRALDGNEVKEIATRYDEHLRVVRRRVVSIDDPVRRDQAGEFLNVLDAASGQSSIGSSLFADRLRLLSIGDELEDVARDNRNLSGNVSLVAQGMLANAKKFALATSAQAERAVNAGLYVLLATSLVAVLISGLIVWLYVERGVVRRLGRITKAMQRLTDGDLSVEVRQEGTHELRALSGAVVAFRDESKQRRALEQERERTNEELRRHREELQDLVDERTEQLQSEVANHAEARGRAEAASRAKSDFLAAMSHEIRTPMSGMLGMLRIISDSSLTPQQRKHLLVATSSSEALLGILNSILDYSKIESAKITLDEVSFDLKATLRGIIDLMRPSAREKNLALTLGWDRKLPTQYLGDAGKLRQIVFNLVSNAIKFTEAGMIRVTVEPGQESAGQQWITITVTDTGVGIPAAELEHVFEPFTQTDASVTRRYGGTGLGLAISRGLATALKGTLDVQSAPGEGSSFVLSLALKHAATESRPKPGRKSRRAEGGRPLHVMVVEDDAATRLVTQRFLEDSGHRVTLAADGYRAIEAAREAVPDLVLMDISLPGMDGIATAAKLRQIAEPGQLPILAMSAHVFKDEVDRYLSAGLDGFIAKPLTPEGLAQAMAAALGDHVAHDGANHLDRLALGADLEALGQETVLRILDIIENTLPERFANMRAVLEAQDVSELASLAHATRSSAASAGFTSLYECAGALEEAARDSNLKDASAHLTRCEKLYDAAIAEARRMVAGEA